MGNKDCGCTSKKEGVTCESVLEGTFTDKKGTVFTATMTATGAGADCISAKLDSEINMEKTLEKFLKNYRPKIVSETHTVKTTCDKSCDKTARLEIAVDGDFQVVGDTERGLFDAYANLFEKNSKNAFLQLTGKNLDIGAQRLLVSSLETIGAGLFRNTVPALLDGKNTKIRILDSQINQSSLMAYVAAIQVSSITIDRAARIITGTVSLPTEIDFIEIGKKNPKKIIINSLDFLFKIKNFDEATGIGSMEALLTNDSLSLCDCHSDPTCSCE